jgi:hypothetical protein
MSVPGGYGQPPQSLLDYYGSVEQGSNRRFDQGLAAQAKQAKAQLDNQYRIAKLQASTAAEALEVDRWYKQQQIQIAQKQFDEGVRQFDKEYGLSEADTTGWFGGKETLEREELNRRYGLDERKFGLDERRFGLDEREMERKYGLVEGELLGSFNGRETLEAQELARRFGLDTSKFGLDVAKTAAEMRSRPDMLFQYGEFARNLPGLLSGQGGQRYGGAPAGQTIAGQLAEVGMGGMQGPWSGSGGPGGGSGEGMVYAGGGGPTEGYGPGLDAGAAARKAAGYQGPGAAPATYGQQAGSLSMSPDMAYLAAASPQSADPTLAAIGKTYQQGFSKLGAQSLESMDKNDLGFLRSGGSFLGYDYDRELRKYAGSRIGQSVGG